MADGVLSSAPNVHSPEFVFRQYRGRRAGIVKALTEGPPPPNPLLSGVDFGAGFFHADGWFYLFIGPQMWRSSTSSATPVSFLGSSDVDSGGDKFWVQKRVSTVPAVIS